MLIKQISVFMENVPGKLGEVTQALGENGIDMSALSLADTTDFGILRLIVNDPDKACQVLRDHDFIVKQSDVVAAVIDDRPGGLTTVLQILSQAKVSVEYMYAFVGSQDGHAVVVMRPDDAEAAHGALDANHLSTLAPKDIYRLEVLRSPPPPTAFPVAGGGFLRQFPGERHCLCKWYRRRLLFSCNFFGQGVYEIIPVWPGFPGYIGGGFWGASSLPRAVFHRGVQIWPRSIPGGTQPIFGRGAGRIWAP